LTALGIAFEVVVPEVEELQTGEPEDAVVENARRKAFAGMDMARGKGNVVLGVDTEVVLDGRLLGKAGNEGEARQRLEALSGRTHEVLGGVVVFGPLGTSKGDSVRQGLTKSTLDQGALPSLPGGVIERSGIARSHVTFRELEAGLVNMYVASGEWRDRAGAYAVQGLGSAMVERTDGDLSNVIGLPVNLLLGLAPELLDCRTSRSDGGLRPDSKV
jgi:septum formation protein